MAIALLIILAVSAGTGAILAYLEDRPWLAFGLFAAAFLSVTAAVLIHEPTEVKNTRAWCENLGGVLLENNFMNMCVEPAILENRG